jgi:hypothetical protein
LCRLHGAMSHARPLPHCPAFPKRQFPKKRKDEVEKLTRERETLTKLTSDATTDDERTRLKKQLADLISKLDQAKTKPVPKVVEKKPSVAEPPIGKLIDPVRYGVLKYQDGNTKAALAAFRLIDPNGQSGEEKAFTQYLVACCLKQQGQMNEAVSLYREIAELKQDPFITECALWQLGAIRQLRELDTQLEQLRVRRKTR